jgi:aerobic carbon-monoxide dehydrogenase medium subunit
VASTGAAVRIDGDVVVDVRIGLAAVGPYPPGLPEIAEALRGRPPSEELYAQAAAVAARSCRPSADQRGSVEYKRHLAGELTRRTLRRAVERVVGNS